MGAFGEPLPTNLPLFPLPGAILLPAAQLPLNVFEPRYLKMTADCFANGRMIGIIQPRDREREVAGEPVPNEAALFDVGTAGRIIRFEETDDGRFLIALMGVGRFVLKQALETPFGYLRGEVDYAPYAHDQGVDDSDLIEREALIRATEAFFATKGIDADWSDVKNADDEVLTTSLSMLLPFSVSEKQALLECRETVDRGAMLTAIMQMAIHEGNTSDEDTEPKQGPH